MLMREERPWGWFEILYEERGMKIKRILVKPGERLSLQSHNQRRENWTFLQGKGLFTLDESRIEVTPHQSVYIPLKSRHRIENIGKEDLLFVEVQTGDYLGEDDIVRYEDDYKRV